MESNPTVIDARVRVADLIADAREALAAPDEVIRAAGLGARVRGLEVLLGDLCDAAADAIASPVLAIDVIPGDVLLLDGTTVTVVSAPRPGVYSIGEARQNGIALDWRGADAARGVIFPPGRRPPDPAAPP